MSGADSIAVAVTFVWLGMVVAISFLEAPVKSRAPGVTLRIGLGIGRLVFRALNTAEALLATAVGITLIVGAHPATVLVPTLTATAVLIVQLVAVRPRLTRRSHAVLAGRDAPRSHSHHVYIGLDTPKVLALLAGGIAMLVTES
jgi:hypothetical protein